MMRKKNDFSFSQSSYAAEKMSVVIEALGDKSDKSTQKVVSEALISLRQRKANVDVVFTRCMPSLLSNLSDISLLQKRHFFVRTRR